MFLLTMSSMVLRTVASLAVGQSCRKLLRAAMVLCGLVCQMDRYLRIDGIHSAGLVGDDRHKMASQASLVVPVSTSLAIAGVDKSDAVNKLAHKSLVFIMFSYQ